MIGPVKESLAVGLHIVLENEEISIPRDRNLIAQVHSIKKSPTNAGYSRYDTETNARAHADGVPTQHNKRWYPSTVWDLYRNRFYTGKSKFNGGWVEGKHEAIVSENLFAQANPGGDAP